MKLGILVRAVAAFAVAVLVTHTVAAQSQTLPTAAIPKEEAAALAQGWVLLAEGKFDEASRKTRDALNRFPRSAGALALLIEADVARGGATTALDAYESWIGPRSIEEPAALRRVARAFLYEWSRQARDVAARTAALLALAEDGDQVAGALVAAGEVGVDASASRGDSKAVDQLIAKLKAAPGSKVAEIQALGATGSTRAAPPLVTLLTDPLPENRAAAAEAIGMLAYRDAIPLLRPLLEDARGQVRVAAAGALFRMGDTGGAQILEELASSEHATIRRSAALLMASQPTESWKSLVRQLASDEDPAIRLDAARLLAPYEPDFARSVFDRLVLDPNVAVREQATLALAESPLSGFPDLRRLLRSGAGPVKVRAARRILQMTR